MQQDGPIQFAGFCKGGSAPGTPPDTGLTAIVRPSMIYC